MHYVVYFCSMVIYLSALKCSVMENQDDIIFQVISANENYEKEITALKENRPLEDSGKQNDRAELEGQIRRLQAENAALQKKCTGIRS